MLLLILLQVTLRVVGAVLMGAVGLCGVCDRAGRVQACCAAAPAAGAVHAFVRAAAWLVWCVCGRLTVPVGGVLNSSDRAQKTGWPVLKAGWCCALHAAPKRDNTAQWTLC